MLIIFELSVVITKTSNSVTNKNFICEDCNVLLITMDALRADHLGCYGYERNTTPTIDSIAKEGVLFENFIANGPITCISLPAFMSGQYPTLSSLGEFLYFKIQHDFITLADTLKLSNYTTRAVINNDIIFTNVLKGFDKKKVFDFNDDELVTAEAIRLINEAKKDKFFLWIHYISPHTPYRPKFPYNETFYKDEFYNPTRKVKKTQIPDIPIGTYLNTTEFDYYITQYDGEIRFIDNEIKIILNYLYKEKLIDNTIIIISSDHGESLGEHEIYFDHGTLYDTDLKIPLIIYNPKSKIKNKRIKEQIQSIDLYPTILNILKLNNQININGKNFYNLITDKDYQERTAYIKGDDEKTFALRTNKLKYINDLEEQLLFDLEKDSLELKNIITEKPELVNNLTKTFNIKI
ncbi:MAG: sulfatase [Nanoarchaeota archaeon]|nr:sulfatase [Nanoarchaeota archaeon]